MLYDVNVVIIFVHIYLNIRYIQSIKDVAELQDGQGNNRVMLIRYVMSFIDCNKFI